MVIESSCDNLAIYSGGGKGSNGKSTNTAVMVGALSSISPQIQQQIVLFDFDSEVGTTTILHKQAYQIVSDCTFSEDPAKQHTCDLLFEVKIENPQVIPIVDIGSGKKQALQHYQKTVGAEAAKELGLHTVFMHLLSRTIESLIETVEFIEENHMLFDAIVVVKNDYGTNNDREEWEAFLSSDPEVKKLGNKLSKLIGQHENLFQIHLPELSYSTYSKLKNRGISLAEGIDKTNSSLRFAERIRLKNVVEAYKAELFPILVKVRGQEENNDSKKPRSSTTKKSNRVA